MAGKEDEQAATELQVSTDEEIDMQLQAAISKYLQNPSKEPLNIVTVGRGGVGKSTLINNLLDLRESDATKAVWSAKPVTKLVSMRTATLNTVPVHIYDTPGLMDEGIDEETVFKDIKEETKDSISLLFYVSSVFSRLDRCDKKVIKALTDVFTPKIWEHTILVLSFADLRCNQPKYVDCTSETARVFQEIIRQNNGCQSVTVSSVFNDVDLLGSLNATDIPAIPTGLQADISPENWRTFLLLAVFRKCDEQDQLKLFVSMIRSNAIVGGVSGVGGGVMGALGGAVLASSMGATTSSMFFGSLLPANSLLSGAFITQTVAASSSVVAAGAAAGALAGGGLAIVLGVGAYWAFKQYVWPTLREKFSEKDETSQDSDTYPL